MKKQNIGGFNNFRIKHKWKDVERYTAEAGIFCAGSYSNE